MTKTLTQKEKNDFALVANFRDKNEKASWLRKRTNLETIVKKIEPIENELLRLNREKSLLIDDVQAIRKTMIDDCIHPKDYLVHCGTYIKCRFCEAKIVIKREE